MLLPSQTPPQVFPAPAQEGREACGSPATALQTPSTQKPVPHWLPELQAWPGDCLGTHCPALHQSAAMQSESAVQSVRQAVAPQM